MTGSEQGRVTPLLVGRRARGVGVAMERTREQRPSRWGEAAGLLPLAAAVALWALIVAGVVAPLGDALARIDARKPVVTPAACAPPADAIASATRPLTSRPCR